MARALTSDRANGATKIESGYQPPVSKAQLTDTRSVTADDKLLKQILSVLERLPIMIGAAVKPPVVNVPAPVVNIEAAKAPDVKINQPPVYVNAPEVKMPPMPRIEAPEQKAPVVNVEPAVVHLSTQRPKEWVFTIHRNDFGQITRITAKAS